MPALRKSLALAAALTVPAFAPACALAASPAELLKFSPTLGGVDYDSPSDKAAVDACKAEQLTGPDGKSFYGFALRDGQGRLLRRFIDTNGTLQKRAGEPKPFPHLDSWSYYQDGFEVYREVDLNEDGFPDEARWLNLGGTRVATIEQNSKAKGYRVVAWKRISAEEASKVLVQAIDQRDPGLLETVMATPEDLQSLGVPAAGIEQATKAASGRRAAFAALLKGLKGWDGSVVWSRFDGTMPHVIPNDPSLKLPADLILYENPIIFGGYKDPSQNPSNLAYLQATEVVKVGETWKFVDLPRAIDPKNPPQSLAQEPGIRAWVFQGAEAAPAAGGVPREVLATLDAYDKNNAPPANATARDNAEYHLGRIKVLSEVVKAAKLPEDKLTYQKEIINSLAAAYQTNSYPKGTEIIESLAKQEGGKLAPYAIYRKVLAEFALESDQPGADYVKVQKDCKEKLEKFVKDYPESEEVADAFYQLATMSEFANDDEAARAYYAPLAQKFPATDPGKKAAGALRRLDLEGKPLALSGAGPKGTAIGTENFKGKTLLVLFWTTGADASRKDLPVLAKLAEKYQGKGFEVLGINLDTDKAALADYLKSNPLPWPNIEEPGGMADGKLANEYGILSTPTMILVDPQGKVINRGVKTVAELERILEKQLSGGSVANLKPGGAR